MPNAFFLSLSLLIFKHRLDCKSFHDMPWQRHTLFAIPDIYIFFFSFRFSTPLLTMVTDFNVPLLSIRQKYRVNFSQNYSQRCTHQHSQIQNQNASNRGKILKCIHLFRYKTPNHFEFNWNESFFFPKEAIKTKLILYS